MPQRRLTETELNLEFIESARPLCCRADVGYDTDDYTLHHYAGEEGRVAINAVPGPSGWPPLLLLFGGSLLLRSRRRCDIHRRPQTIQKTSNKIQKMQ